MLQKGYGGKTELYDQRKRELIDNFSPLPIILYLFIAFSYKIIIINEGGNTPSSGNPVYRIEQGGDESRQLPNN
jgi:hypothetical protein